MLRTKHYHSAVRHKIHHFFSAENREELKKKAIHQYKIQLTSTIIFSIVLLAIVLIFGLKLH